MTRKRKAFTDKFKAKVALEAIQSGKTLAQLASEYKVHPNQISTWKKTLISGAPELFAKGSSSAGRHREKWLSLRAGARVERKFGVNAVDG